MFLRIDFLAYYETGFDQNDGTVGVNHGRDGYVRALQWMREAAEDMQLSLVLPNLFDHGSAERQYGDLIRIDNDAGFGTWFTFSGGRETWQPEWSQWNNPFMGFTGFADVSGRGQVILDGDPLIMRTFTRDEERQSTINLFTMAGAAIAITDQVDTIADNAHIFQNREVLALRKEGLVGKPVFNNSHALDYDPTSRDPERWIGQLPDGSGRSPCSTAPTSPRHQVDHFADILGFGGPAAVRDLWAHQDLGSMTGYQARLGPHASVLLSVVPQGTAHFQAEVGAWAGSARFENTFGGHEGMGYVTDLENVGSSVAMGIAVPKAGSRRLVLPRGQRHREPVHAHGARARSARPAVCTAPPSSTCRARRHGQPGRRAGHARHGGGHQPRRPQRGVGRPGRRQSRLRRPGLRPSSGGSSNGAQRQFPASRPTSSGGPHGGRRRTPRRRAVPSCPSPGGRQQGRQRELAFARQQPFVQRGVERIGLGRRRRVAELDARGWTSRGWSAAARRRAHSGSSARRRA